MRNEQAVKCFRRTTAFLAGLTPHTVLKYSAATLTYRLPAPVFAIHDAVILRPIFLYGIYALWRLAYHNTFHGLLHSTFSVRFLFRHIANRVVCLLRALSFNREHNRAACVSPAAHMDRILICVRQHARGVRSTAAGDQREDERGGFHYSTGGGNG